ncbi:lipoprotein [Geomonas limicola]|uniref:Lipoprotein n=1 Tax=Geomonas limicola TaxID=2740186 RepID=A0A6V8NCZ0_9BACT|nr:tetratricopeptide repeat protein [Geomonas limicola]GFO70290.1 lipoprotein [Geomonas limicola]
MRSTGSTFLLMFGVLCSLLLVPVGAGAGDAASIGADAKALVQEGQYDKAIEELRAGYSLFPYNETLRHDLAQAYLSQAQRNLNLSRFTEAAENYSQARELYPGESRFTLMRGVALYFAKNFDSARAELNQLGESAEALTYLGKICYDTGDLNGALDNWRRAETLGSDPGVKKLIAKAERELPVESRMDKGYSSMFDITFDAELPPGLSAEVLDALETAYNSVGTDLGLFPTARIPVLLYTKQEYSSVTNGPDWSGGLYDGKIRLPLGGVSNMTPQLRGVLFHEFTHVLVAEITGGNVPTWLNEGLAQIEEFKEYGAAMAAQGAPLAKEKLLSMRSLSGSFVGLDRESAGLAYRQSYSLTSFMVQRYGWYAMQNVLKNLKDRVKIEVAVSKALADWSLDMPAVQREWRESLGLPAEAAAP